MVWYGEYLHCVICQKARMALGVVNFACAADRHLKHQDNLTHFVNKNGCNYIVTKSCIQAKISCQQARNIYCIQHNGARRP